VRVVSERLAEDETLRGDLTDNGFGPTLAFVTSLLPAAARQSQSTPDISSPEDEVSRAARGLTREIVAAAESGDMTELQANLAAPMFTARQAALAQEALSQELAQEESADARAQRIIERLQAAVAEEKA
jgi:hypothetical protein